MTKNTDQYSADRKRKTSTCGQIGLVFPAVLCILISPLVNALPSTKIGTAALISPSAADTYYGTSTANTNSIGATGYQNEIVELARALNHDPDEIYDFVRNYVDTVFIYGLQKGAIGAIIDKSGTPFDQAQLMVELLRQSGYTANYQVGTITLNNAQFSAWTGVTNAQAACNLLSSGGIPASINGGSSSINCSSISNTSTISTVQLGHIWVSVVIGGTTYVFDPSYKQYDFRSSVNLTNVTGLTSGNALTQASTGMRSGTTSGVGYIQNVNSGNLNGLLTTYATNIQNYIRTGNSAASVPLISGQIKDLVGGGDIHRVNGSQRITSLPYPATATRTWSGDIPDQFRTSLRVQLTLKLASDGSFVQTTDKTLFVDEIYGRKLVYNTNFNMKTFSGALDLVDEFANTVHLGSYSVTYNASPTQSQSPGYSQGTITLSVNHPYAADAAGSTTAVGSYMDESFSSSIIYSTPFTIVHGWGDTNRGLIDKWSSRLDTALPTSFTQGCAQTECDQIYFASAGDGRREQLAAAWLVQASKAARLHAAIANAIYTHHHTIGVVSGDSQVNLVNINGPNQTPNYRPFVADNLDRIDVDTGFSLTTLGADSASSTARRAAVHAIAATEAALEGSVIGQTANLPDVVSVAARFGWGASPPPNEDLSGTPAYGPRPFYEFTSTNASDLTQVQPLMIVEGKTTAPTNNCAYLNSEPILGPMELARRLQVNAYAISAYASAGFDVIAPSEAFLGPGQRGGYRLPCGSAYPNQFTYMDSQQRGGALVATRYDASGNPLEIAHVAVNTTSPIIKGGGGGIQPDHAGVYDPSTAADILKSRFVDRSKLLGVDLQNGSVTYASPASLTVGTGEFPYSLTANLIWRGGNLQTTEFGPRSDIEPQAPWTTNWNNTLTVSGSGLEAMGEGDIRATAGTVAAFVAMQDIYKSAVSPAREVSAVLVASWWVQQLTGNVVTVNVGTDTRQFVRAFDGNWIATGPGAFATLNQSGNPVIYTDTGCNNKTPSTQPRGWDYSNVSFSVTNTHGDIQNFGYWVNYATTAGKECSRLHGFRLTNWSFPQGVTVNLVYGVVANQFVQDLEQLIEVNNSLGRKIEFVNSGLGGFNNGLSGADYRGVTINESNPGYAGTTSITDATGAATTTVVHNTAGQRHLLSQVFDANNSNVPSLQYTYDTLNRVAQVQDAEALQVGDRAPYQFHIGENVRSDRIDPAGGYYTVIYDLYRRPFATIDEIGRTITITHDGRGRLASNIYPEGDQEVFTYDDRNNTTSLTKVPKPGSGQSNIVVQAQWNTTWNKPDWIKDALNNETDFVYYPSGQAGASLLQTATRPAPISGGTRPVYGFTYNGYGQVVDSTDPTSLVTHNVYAAASPGVSELQSTAVDPTGVNSVASFTYDANGNVLTTTDPRAFVTEFQYDNDRRKTYTLSHNGDINAALLAAKHTTYDVLGRVISEEGGTAFSGLLVTSWQTLKTTSYTATSKVLTQTDASGNVTTYKYDPVDRPVVVTDPDNRQVGTVYDLAGQSLCTWKGWNSASAPTGCTWNPSAYAGTGPVRYAAYTYSPNGQQLTVTDANNNLSQYQYDGFDRLLRLYFPISTKGSSTSNASDYEQYAYDANGNRTSLLKRDGNVIGYTYDNLNRLTKKDIPNTTTQDICTSYDLAGRPSYIKFGDATGTSATCNTVGNGVVYTYDTAKRKIGESSYGRAVSFAYDKNGNRTQTTWPDGYYVTYQYDPLNQMQYVRENSTTANELAYYAYDPLSRRQTLRLGGQSTNETTYSYELNSSLKTLTQYLNATTVNLSYGRNKSGQITTISASDDFYLSKRLADNGQVQLSWTPASDNVGVTTYTVERCSGAGCSSGFTTLASGITGNTYLDTAVTGSNYGYRIRALDAANNGTYSTAASPGAGSTDTQAPSAISGLTATAASSSQINLSWTAATDNVGVTNYAIERCQGSSCSNFVQLATVTGTTYSNTGLASSTSYSYRVRALDAANNIGGPSVQSATTQTGGAPTPITYVQGNWTTPDPQSSVSVTFNSAQSPGDLNVVIVSWNDTVSQLMSVIDSNGNTYTPAVGPTVSPNNETQYIYYAKNIRAAAAGANTVTVTFNAAVPYPDIRIAEYSGIDTTNPVDVATGASGDGSDMNSGPITTTNANDLLVAGNELAQWTNATDPSYNERYLTGDGSILEDRVVNSIGTYSADATQGAGWWVMQIVAFKAATVGGGGGGGGTDTQAPTAPTNLLVTFSSGQNYVSNGLNQYSTVGGNNYTYDLNGNLTSWVASDGRHTYTYDVENRLITAAVGGSSTPSITYAYDPLGRRISKTVGGIVTQQYLLDGDEEIAELDGSGNVLRRYITGPAVDDRIARAEGSAVASPTKYYYHVNHQGSVIDMTDVSGTIQQQLAYDAYGNLTSDQPPASVTGEQFRYTGRRFDVETGLYYYRARYYAPQIGRFLQTDPIGYKDEFNLYAYVGGDSSNRKDPSGTYSCGSSLSQSQCAAFTAAQDAAKRQIATTVSAFKEIQAKIDAGKKLTSSEQKLADSASKVLGKGAGTNSKALGKLIETAGKMQGELNSSKPAEFGGANKFFDADAGYPTKLVLYQSFFSSSDKFQSQTIAHESFHHGTGLKDVGQQTNNGGYIGPYGFENAIRRAEYLHNPLEAMRNPDAVTYALGFEQVSQ